MPTLAHSSAHMLEFESFRDLLREYISSALGQGELTRLQPSSDRAWIARQHQLTEEIREYGRVDGRFEFSGLSDVTRLTEKARIEGSALETGEIRDIITLADRAAEWREIALEPPQAMRNTSRFPAALAPKKLVGFRPATRPRAHPKASETGSRPGRQQRSCPPPLSISRSSCASTATRSNPTAR
jgi:hypothetical protein